MLHLPKSARYAAGSRTSPGARCPAPAIGAILIVSCVAIVLYWHLDSEYRALGDRYRELQEKFHAFIAKKEALQLQYKDLQTIGQQASKKVEEIRDRLSTCEKERDTLEVTLRKKQREIDAFPSKTAALADASPLTKRENLQKATKSRREKDADKDDKPKLSF